MSTEVRNLEPKAVWNFFSDLNEVPRPSKKEERVIAFMKEFGEKLGLDTMVDGVGNVIIKKPASAGMENRVTVALQSHLDMVHQKNGDTNFDFDSEGIRMFIEGDWVKAEGTTLGADNGMGVAAIMTLLASDEIPHPPLEALFTIDEETGMTGAMGLVGGLLSAEIMLNLDTEDDDELTIGCAGGIDVTATGEYSAENAASGSVGYRIDIKGLTGGHSGMDIHRGRGNANKLMNRLLINAVSKFGAQIGQVDGGGLRNAIPRESFAEIAVSANQKAGFEAYIKELTAVFQDEHGTTDPEVKVMLSSIETPAKVVESAFINKIMRSIYTCPNGIYRMSPDIEGLTQTSNNLSRVLIKEGKYSVQCLTRSSVDSEKFDLADAITACFELSGASVATSGDYPGWAPRPSAAIVSVMSDLYQELFEEPAQVMACHAGLECGILGTHYPEIEMISFGPNIRGAHSPDEKVQISSVQKFWGFLLETLKRVPVKS